MTPPDGTRLERRRAKEFERELLTRARTWIPSWSLDDAGADFGLALLKIAARFNSEVAQRLDKANVKMARGFLDWLGIPALAARPARVPVVFKMADTAGEPVLALRPVKMQADVGTDSPATFETESDLQVIPGQLAMVVGVDPAEDRYFLPPPGLMSLAPLEPLPTAWKLKNFVAPGSKSLQLDPGIGLAKGMLLEIAGAQYRIDSAKDDLVKLEQEISAGDGLAAGTRVTKVETFRPFSGARNLQQHILYIGDGDALNIEAAARIEVIAPAALREGATWEYWGKADGDDGAAADAAWLALPMTEIAPERLIFAKPEGPIEEKEIQGVTARWIRARCDRSEQPIGTDSIELKINPSDLPAISAAGPAPDPPPIDLFVNATAAPTRDVFLFGQEPRQFDTLYVGCAEAFSKTDANVAIDFELSDGAFGAMSAFNGNRLGPLLAGVDKGGSLHIFSVAADGKLTRLSNREPLRPEPRDATDSGASNYTLTSSDLRPPMWLAGDVLFVAVAAKGEVWVRVEAPPIQIPFLGFTQPAQGKWEFWGAPGGNAEDPITGMAVINVAGVPTLVALTKSGALKRKATASAGWQDQPLALPLNHKLIEIAGVRTANPLKAADNFLAVSVPPAAAGPFTLRLSSSAAAMISNIDPSNLIPFGFEGAGGTTTAVVAKLGPRRLVAQRGAGAPEEVELGNVDLRRTDLQKVLFDGNDDGGQFTVYGTGDLGGTPVLLAWRPFDPASKDLLIPTSVEILTGEPKGPVAVSGGRVFLPGDRKGELLTATVAAPTTFSTDGTDFLSALAVPTTVQLPAGFDRLFVKGDPDPVEVTLTALSAAGVGSYAGTTFYWLNERVDRDTSEDDTFFFSAGTGLQGTVVSHTVTGPADESEFDIPAPDPMPQVGTVLLIDQGTQGGSEDPVTVTAINARRITVEPSLSALDGETVDYRVPDTIIGRVFPTLTLDNSNNTLDVARALVSGIHFPDLEPHRQPVIAVAETGGTPPTPERLALELEWTPPGPVAGNVDFFVSTASAWSQSRAAVAATAVLAWEYWDGSSWSVLELTKDETSHLRQSGTVEFTVPRDLKPVDWAGKTSHWVRARIIAGNYGEAKVEVVSEQTGTTTTQTVKRTTDNLQPPYAINVSVSYAVDKSILPTYLITSDSGSTRDQSDANRTPGAQVEIFMPLADALRRFDAPAASASSVPACVADCACDTGTPSMSPASGQATPEAAVPSAGASGADSRAIYLGFTSKLFGQPVNVLFSVARENDYDSIGPLRIDALIKDRFAPIVAEDETRAIGETGLIKMAFDDAPLKAELFGQALSWLRLTPRVGSDAWAPAVAGVYANGVWAHAAETMTRELLGSSDGRPDLTVDLARPPLLEGSLELRVREPLGEEELQALTTSDPALVKSNETDLPGNWILWKEVRDPADCGPKERVYALDEATGAVRFGDGRNGMIPPPGTDSIVAFSYAHTEPPGTGPLAENLVQARQELNLVTPVETVESAAAAGQSAGGAGPESIERVMRFAPATLRHRRRAVSLRDFEDLVLEESEEVVQARAFRRGSGVRLVVVTRGADSGPSRAQRRELRAMLLDSAPAALSARDALTIAGPRVRKLSVSLDLRVADLDLGGRVASAAKSRLAARFAPDGGWSLGRTPREDDVAEALLDIAGLDGFASIIFRELDQVGQEEPWDRPVARDELVTLAPEDILIRFELPEAVA